MEFLRPSLAIFCAPIATLALTACSSTDGSVVHHAEYEQLRDRGLRIAIVPFAVTAGEEDAVSSALAPLGNLLALDGLTDDAPAVMTAGSVMERALTSLLADSSLEIEEIWVTRTELSHAGFSGEDSLDRSRSLEIARLLQVDAVLYGEVYEWDRSYYGLQSTQSVGLRTWLIDGESGDELVRSERWRREGTGITGGPTGQISALTAPIQGLQSSTLSMLALYVAYDAATDLLGREPLSPITAENARGEVPRVSFAAIDPANSQLAPGDHLTVVAVATAGATVSFDIGRYRTRVPMVETRRDEDARGDRSTYLGSYVVQEGEELDEVPVIIRIERLLSSGRRLRGFGKEVTMGRVSLGAAN